MKSLLAFPQALPELEGGSEVVEGVEIAIVVETAVHSGQYPIVRSPPMDDP